jgi:hypothetical protein
MRGPTSPSACSGSDLLRSKESRGEQDIRSLLICFRRRGARHPSVTRPILVSRRAREREKSRTLQIPKSFSVGWKEGAEHSSALIVRASEGLVVFRARARRERHMDTIDLFRFRRKNSTIRGSCSHFRVERGRERRTRYMNP